MDNERVMTPPAAVDAASWLASIPILDVVWVAGAAFQLMAINQGMTEAELYAEFARLAAADPDCNVVRG